MENQDGLIISRDTIDPTISSVSTSHLQSQSDSSSSSSLSTSLPLLPNPLDRSSYLNRVSTFTPLRWLLRPLSLSPLQAARYGWKCIERDILQCEVCHKRATITIPLKLSKQQAEAFSLSLQPLFISSHDSDCIWQFESSPIEFTNIYSPGLALLRSTNETINSLKQLNYLPGPFTSFHIDFREKWMDACDQVNIFPLDLSLFELLSICGWRAKLLEIDNKRSTENSQTKKRKRTSLQNQSDETDNSEVSDVEYPDLECIYCTQIIPVRNFVHEKIEKTMNKSMELRQTESNSTIIRREEEKQLEYESKYDDTILPGMNESTNFSSDQQLEFAIQSIRVATRLSRKANHNFTPIKSSNKFFPVSSSSSSSSSLSTFNPLTSHRYFCPILQPAKDQYIYRLHLKELHNYSHNSSSLFISPSSSKFDSVSVGNNGVEETEASVGWKVTLSVFVEAKKEKEKEKQEKYIKKD